MGSSQCATVRLGGFVRAVARVEGLGVKLEPPNKPERHAAGTLFSEPSNGASPAEQSSRKPPHSGGYRSISPSTMSMEPMIVMRSAMSRPLAMTSSDLRFMNEDGRSCQRYGRLLPSLTM